MVVQPTLKSIAKAKTIVCFIPNPNLRKDLHARQQSVLENRPQGGSVGVRQIQTSPILKQLKSIKVALWAQFVITGGIALGRCVIVYFTDLAE